MCPLHLWYPPFALLPDSCGNFSPPTELALNNLYLIRPVLLGRAARRSPCTIWYTLCGGLHSCISLSVSYTTPRVATGFAMVQQIDALSISRMGSGDQFFSAIYTRGSWCRVYLAHTPTASYPLNGSTACSIPRLYLLPMQEWTGRTYLVNVGHLQAFKRVRG